MTHAELRKVLNLVIAGLGLYLAWQKFGNAWRDF